MSLFSPEYLTRRALELNALQDRDVAQQTAEQARLAAEQTVKRERVAGYLATFVDWARASGYRPLRVCTILNDYLTPPTDDVVYQRSRADFRGAPTNYTKWRPDGVGYLCDYRLYQAEDGDMPSGMVVTTDMRCYNGLPTRIDGVWRGRQHTFNAFVHREANSYQNTGELELAWLDDTIQNQLEQAAAGLLRGDYPYDVHRR